MTVILTTQREKEILDKIITVIRDLINPEKIYIFGSRAKGTAFFF